MNQFRVLISSPIGLALALSVLVHVGVIGTLGFSKPKLDRVKDKTPPLEIVLVNAKTKSAPLKAEALAQSNLDRGGNTDSNRRIKSPVPVPAIQPVKQTIKPLTDARLSSIKSTVPSANKSSQQTKAPVQEQEVQDILTQTHALHPVESAPPKRALPEPEPELVQQEASTSPVPSANLLARSLEAARLEAMISRTMDDYQKRPKRKFLGGRTMEYRFAAYVESWRQKVEKVGNLNYPAAAKEQKLYGQLRMTVSIRADGSVEKIELNKSSGYKILDEAARRIVELAAPYSEFPPDIRRDTEILDIVRTWTFTREDTLAGAD